MDNIEFKPQGTKLRLIPILGILFLLVGYIFVAVQLKNLQEKKETLLADIALLEMTKTRLTSQSKEKDKIITRQSDIIEESGDSNTKVLGKELNNEFKKSTIYKTLINPSKDGLQIAKDMENKAYMFLYNKEIDSAIHYFKESESAYNGYNQVYEIGFYLNTNRDRLKTGDPKLWRETYKKILTDFRWKMPEQIKTKLQILGG